MDVGGNTSSSRIAPILALALQVPKLKTWPASVLLLLLALLNSTTTEPTRARTALVDAQLAVIQMLFAHSATLAQLTTPVPMFAPALLANTVQPLI